MAKTYAEQFKDPRWQKMRLKVMERDNFTCRACGDKDSQLHVHHSYYGRNIPPWNYPIESLVTLCDDCHGYRHDFDTYIRIAIANLTNKEYEGLYNLLCACEFDWTQYVEEDLPHG